MANLGTLDRMQGLQGIANGIAQNAIRNGSWGDKLAALIGGYVGDRMGQHKYKKEQQKLDDIVNAAKSTEVIDPTSMISTTPISQDEYNYLMNGNVPSSGTPGISTEPLADAGLLQNSVGAQGPATQKIAFNPNYNMDYIEREARRQGIHSRAWDERKDALQRDVARNAEAFYLPQIQQKLYGSSKPEDMVNNYLDGYAMIQELGKYSPDAAKAYQALVLGSLQGNQKFEQQKQLLQIKADNAVARANQQHANKIAYKGGYDPTKVNNAIKGIQEIEQIVADGGTLTPAMRQAYNMHRRYLDSLGGAFGATQNNANTQTTQNQQHTTQQPSVAENVRGILNSIDFSNYDSDKLASGKKYNFANGTQAIVDAMRNAGAKDDQIFKAVDDTLAKKEAAGELPEGYRESFAHSMGRKTAKEMNDEAIAAQERKARELDMKLHPEKYDIDPFDGVKYFADAVANGKPLINLAGNYK